MPPKKRKLTADDLIEVFLHSRVIEAISAAL